MKNINDEIEQVDWKNDDKTIEFYEKNKLYFDNSELIAERDRVVQFITIKLRYAEAIYRKFRYNQVIEITSQVENLTKKLLPSDPEFLKADQYRRFLLGMSLGRKKSFKIANGLFKKLVAEDPNNHYYQVWYNHTKIRLYNWVFNGAAIIGGLLVLINLLFSLDKKYGVPFGTIGLAITFIAFLTQEGLKYYHKRKTTTNTTG